MAGRGKDPPVQMAAYGPLRASDSKPQEVMTCVFPLNLGATGHFSGITSMGTYSTFKSTVLTVALSRFRFRLAFISSTLCIGPVRAARRP